MSNRLDEKKVILQAAILGIVFTLSFLGWNLLKGREVGLDDFIVAILIGIIVGMGNYIIGIKKAKK